ncbi:hypothetical protein PsorP6_017491 [Peronosclerospora sorghi]|uniref:Uncharacterized protein n=1 Tax=Peronosclerospora sorghi TaxID=230839 RepID=A0ACC0WPN6_9STRA|nr:hypothetical protein PsorP6_017491 [Peronosclerospora sorghi]
MSLRSRCRAPALIRARFARLLSIHHRDLDTVYRQLLEKDGNAPFQITEAQSTAVRMALKGYSVFLHLPTGAGKSLAFQAPALLTSSNQVTLVVSPLVALMHDQVAALKRKGIDAIYLSGNEKKNPSVPLSQRLNGQKLVYTTPEFVQMNSEMKDWVRAAGKDARLARVVLDEAHCVLEWGNTFRPTYLQLSQWKTHFLSDVPITLATASISNENIARLAEMFCLKWLPTGSTSISDQHTSVPRHHQLVLVQQMTDRNNLRLEVVRKETKSASWIKHRVGNKTTIVYCLTRKEAEETCLSLVRLGCAAGVYHGGVPRRRRDFVRKQWMMGQLTMICATSAFGGRSGRDGKPASCILLYSEADKERADAVTTETMDVDASVVVTGGSARGHLDDMVAFCELTSGCRKQLLYCHFDLQFDGAECSRNCNCNGPLEAAVPSWCKDEEMETNEDKSRTREDETRNKVPNHVVEYHYQKIVADAKRLKLPKREALSRRLIRAVLEAKPASQEEMASMRGIGPAKASRYYQFLCDNCL